MTEGLTIRHEPVRGVPQRVRYEPRADGGWRRIDEVWTGCEWRHRGAERVESVSIEVGAQKRQAVLDALDIVDE